MRIDAGILVHIAKNVHCTNTMELRNKNVLLYYTYMLQFQDFLKAGFVTD
jgi:hypothetical protein